VRRREREGKKEKRGGVGRRERKKKEQGVRTKKKLKKVGNYLFLFFLEFLGALQIPRKVTDELLEEDQAPPDPLLAVVLLALLLFLLSFPFLSLLSILFVFPFVSLLVFPLLFRFFGAIPRCR
jgi:hypothetical protein